MTKGTIAKQASLLTLATLLAACGGAGGGVNGTPTPTAGGGSGNTGGTGGGSTPTPTPTPINTSLAPITYSQSFQAFGSTGTINATATTVGKTSVSISYNADRRSYTVSVPGRNLTVDASDLSAADSTTAIDAYKKSAGGVTDSLVLTRTGSGSTFGLSYVSGGFWQRTGSDFGSLDAFTYGIDTPANATPRSGSGFYGINLVGVVGYPTDARSLGGKGILSVDFAAGAIDMRGEATEVNYPLPRYFRGTAQLSSVNGSFTGTFGVDDQPGAPFGWSGTVDGGFYGPNAEEVGAAFAVRSNSSTGRGAITGAIFGSRNPSLLAGQTLAESVSVNTPAILVQGGGAGLSKPITWSASRTPAAANRYLGASNTFSNGKIAPELSNDRFTVFRAPNGELLYSFNADTKNPDIALTYMSFATTTDTFGGAKVTGGGEWEVYGLSTPLGVVPRVGAARYNGKVYGVGIPFKLVDIPNSGLKEFSATGVNYIVNGSAEINFNFTRGDFTGSVDLQLKDHTTGQISFAPSYSMAGVISVGRDNFTGDFGIQPGVSGSIVGRFYGPFAQEAGAGFSINADKVGGVDLLTLRGVILTKRQ